MKKVLLATTMLVAGASIAAAEVTVSGDARMGIISNGSDNGATPAIDESAVAFTSRARVTFTLSGESDSGLSFGASFRADNSAAAATGTAGSVFISGAFGNLSAGDVDGAAQSATGHVAGVGLTGLGDLNESTFLGAGGLNNVDQAFAGAGQTANPLETNDPTFLYQYSFGDFTVYASATNPADITTGGAAAVNALSSNAQAYAIGGKYTFGDYAVGLGYEKLSGFIAPTAAGAPLLTAAKPANNTNAKHVVVTLEGTVAGITMKGLYGKASGTYAGAQIVGGGDNGKQYAASASYTTGALTGSIFYTDDSALGGTTAYGIGAAYDLGGGAVVQGGYAVDHDAFAGAGSAAFDLGIALTF
ncbi:MAG: porin [Paracoccaceae bacterium]